MRKSPWQEVLEAPPKPKSKATGMNWLTTLSSVLNFASDDLLSKDLEFRTPVPDFRRWVSRKSRTKKGRAESAASQHIRPIEDASDLHARRWYERVRIGFRGK